MAFWNNHYVEWCVEVVLALSKILAKNPLDAVARNCMAQLATHGEADAVASVPLFVRKDEQNEVPSMYFPSQVIADLKLSALAETALSRPT